METFIGDCFAWEKNQNDDMKHLPQVCVLSFIRFELGSCVIAIALSILLKIF